MKQLLALLALILVGAFGIFLYRNTLERPTEQVGCTLEAMICPDGSSVGRTGPECAFAACPTSAATSLPEAGISFILPAGYVDGVQLPGADGKEEDLLHFYQMSAPSGEFHYLSFYRYALPEGKTPDEVILAHTRYQPSDMAAEDFSRFETSLINGRTYRSTVIERFEGQVLSSYFLERENDVLRFDILERNVDWTNPDLDINALPEHKALLEMLATLETR
ncbi:MAG: hypothetical protein AB199_00210 [Parcubacteria bacterium C7867-004]|nr:MAG: hypothetical protein AB199_00210 [Parcubacteria bacterium C7867-004]